MMLAVERSLHRLATESAFTARGAVLGEELFVRSLALRRVEEALRRAQLNSVKTEPAHLARVALLSFKHGRELAWDDEASVLGAYQSLPVPRPQRVPVVLFGVFAALTMLLGASLGARHLLRPFEPAEKGVGRALRFELSAYEAAWINGHRSRAGHGFEDVLGGQRAELGPAGVTAFEALFASYEKTSTSPQAIDELYRATRAVNRALADRAQPFYLDARLHRVGEPLVYAFYREREDRADTPGFETERVVFLWRLDTLNIKKAVLGYTHREADAAIVLYDQVETFLIDEVLPALADDEIVHLVDVDTRRKNLDWANDIETRSARMVRESFAEAVDRPALVRVGQLLARRRAIVAKWREELSGQNVILRPPARLIPEADYAKDLWMRVPTASRHAWEEIHEELGSKRITKTFETLRDRFAREVARHEVQHRLDGQRTAKCVFEVPCEGMRAPAPIARLSGLPEGAPPMMVNTFEWRLAEETSAYLAEVAQGAMPKMTILSLLAPLLEPASYDSVYSNAAILVLQQLSDVMSLSDPALPLTSRGMVQRPSVSSLVVLLFAKTDAELNAAATKAWSDVFQPLYGVPLPRPTFAPVFAFRAWRH